MRIIAGPCQHETLEQSISIAETRTTALAKNGWQIGVQSVYFNGVEINTPEDVETWQQKNLQ